MRFFSLMLFAVLSCVSLVASADDRPALVPEVRVSAGNSLGSGTVFYLDTQDNAYILTNHHVAGRRGSRVGVEFWTEGKLLPQVPGIVVEAQIDGGYTDVAVVKIAAADLPGTPGFVQLAKPGESVAVETVIMSLGSPGGTWQTRFTGRVFKSDKTRMEFYPRPGGGRSGSSVQRDGKIVGLLTWSSGKPSWEEHGTDGMGYKSGFGIAQQIDQVWAVLRGQTNLVNGPLPPGYTPLVLKRSVLVSVSVGLPQEVDLKSSPQEPTGDGFTLTPDDQDALLRRLRDNRPDPAPLSPPSIGLLPGSRPSAPSVQRPFVYGLGVGAGRWLGFAVLLAVVLAFGFYVLRRKGWLVILIAIVPGSMAIAQDSELESLAQKWSQVEASTGTNWGSYETAWKAHQQDGGTIVTIVTIPGCAPCQKMKAELKELDKFGYFNKSHTSIVDAEQNPELAKSLCGGNAGKGYPCLVIQKQVQDDTGKRIVRVSHVGLFPSPEDVEKRLAEFNGRMELTAESVSQFVTLRDFLTGLGVE